MRENDTLSDYLQSLYGIEPLSVQEEHELADRIAQGDDEALERLVTHNLRFVVHIVSKMTAWQHGKMPVEDMVAMGNEALYIAARRWTPTNNARFATYAKLFIEKGVTRELDNTSNIIRLPINIMEQIKRLKYNERTLYQILGRRPKTDELAKVMNVPESKISQLYNYLLHEPVSIELVNPNKNPEEQGDE